LNFQRYRESIMQIQKLADKLPSLTRVDLAELNKLNEECLSFNEEIVKAFSALVDEIEEGLTPVLDRLDRIKQDLTKISGPDGTLGDILQLENAWSRAVNLRDNIRAMTGPSGTGPMERLEAGTESSSPGEKAPPSPKTEKGHTDLQDLIGLAQKEAAAATEKAPAEKPLPAPKIQKKEDQESRGGEKPAEAAPPAQKHQAQKKDLKIIPSNPKAVPSTVTLSKNIGEAEKKLMAEITKNIEAIKSGKKK